MAWLRPLLLPISSRLENAGECGARVLLLVSNIDMHMYDPPYALWSIWRQLSLLDRGVIMILYAVFIYCVFSTIRTMLQLRSVWNRPNENIVVVHQGVATLATRYSNVRQVIGAAFYLFGLVLFLGLEAIPNVLGDGKEPLGTYVLDSFLLQCAFAANVFLIFLVLHLIQWSGSAVLDSLSRQLRPQFLGVRGIPECASVDAKSPFHTQCSH